MDILNEIEKEMALSSAPIVKFEALEIGTFPIIHAAITRGNWGEEVKCLIKVNGEHKIVYLSK